MIVKKIPMYEISYWDRLWNATQSGSHPRFQLRELCTHPREYRNLHIECEEDATAISSAQKKIPCCPKTVFIGNDGEDLNDYCQGHSCAQCWERKWKGERFRGN